MAGRGSGDEARTERHLTGREDGENEDALVLDVARRRAVLGAVEEARCGGRDPVVRLGIGQQLERAGRRRCRAPTSTRISPVRASSAAITSSRSGRGTDDERRPIADNHGVAVAVRIETFAGDLDERAWPALDWRNLVDAKHSNQWC